MTMHSPRPSRRSSGRGSLIAAVALSVLVATAAANPVPAVADHDSNHSSGQVRSRLTEAGGAVLTAGGTAFVGRVDDGQLVTTVSLGVADRRTGRPARATDQFQIGSNTKTMVATIALQLVGERRLQLTDTVEQWLPGVVPNGDRITLQMLLQHTSGLFDYAADETFNESLLTDPGQRWTPGRLVAVGLSHPPTFAPGEGWSYSNTGYVLTGMILEKATGASIRALLSERIIRPLHLRDTYWKADSRFHGRHLHGYYRTEPNGTEYVDVSNDPLFWADAAGALVSTTADLAAFGQALQGGDLLQPAQLARMRATVDVPGTDGQYGYGLGIICVGTPAGVVWGHTGGTIGYLTQAWASEDGTRSLVEVVPTGASTPAGPDSAIDGAASGAATSLFDLMTTPPGPTP